MDKENRPKRRSGKNLQTPHRPEVQADSGSAGKGGSGTWVNERGELCIGSECFTLIVKPNAEEVTVHVDRNKCGADLQPIIDEVFAVIGKGGRTVYESTSIVKK